MMKMMMLDFQYISAETDSDWRRPPSRQQDPCWWSRPGSSDTLRRKRIITRWHHRFISVYYKTSQTLSYLRFVWGGKKEGASSRSRRASSCEIDQMQSSTGNSLRESHATSCHKHRQTLKWRHSGALSSWLSSFYLWYSGLSGSSERKAWAP